MPVESADFSSLQGLKNEHAGLAAELASIGHLLAVPRRSKTDVAGPIGELADRIESHFRYEEEGGYFRAALRRAPRLAECADRLLVQHADLLERVERLRILARSGVETEGWWEQMDKQFAAFKARLLEHERQEIALLQEAFGVDIGASD